MFAKEVKARYQVLCYDDMLNKMVDEAEDALDKAEIALKKAQDEFEKLIDIEDTPTEKLQEMEKKIEELSK